MNKCIYALVLSNGTVVYVGKEADRRRRNRLTKHLIEKTKKFDEYVELCYYEREEVGVELEKAMIKQFTPRYNKQLNKKESK